MKAILFDLDDTLYAEFEYVKSGYKAVAEYLSKQCSVDAKVILDNMLSNFKQSGREKIFDKIVRTLNLNDSIEVKALLYIYRIHKPHIKLFKDAIWVLKELRNEGFKLGIITDGLGSVQKNKIEALKIQKYFDLIICTDDIGPDACKPSLIPFQLAMKLINIKNNNAYYIGDNPAKDFYGPKKLGMKTIRVRQIMDSDYVPQDTSDDDYLAEYEVYNLMEILPIIKGKMDE